MLALLALLFRKAKAEKLLALEAVPFFSDYNEHGIVALMAFRGSSLMYLG
ncbi:MAG: hypothetical protein GY820_46585 [Gammaproteobacteria bacterium]|nr:hypothetical protein [Gammaproteobacteria bacterium]